MEAIFLVCGAGGPQLKRNPLASGTFSFPPQASMRIIDLDALPAAPIFDYHSREATATSIGQGSGEGHIYWLRFEPGGAIGPHPAGPAQLLIPVEGRGWAAGPDAVRQSIGPGQAAVISPGELHSKGSQEGMKALMIRLSTLMVEFR